MKKKMQKIPKLIDKSDVDVIRMKKIRKNMIFFGVFFLIAVFAMSRIFGVGAAPVYEDTTDPADDLMDLAITLFSLADDEDNVAGSWDAEWENFMGKILNDDVTKWILRTDEALEETICTSQWFGLDINSDGSAMGVTSASGASFNINSEYVNVSTSENEEYIHKVAWFVQVPGGDSSRYWKFKIYFWDEETGDKVSLYSHEDSGDDYIHKVNFGSGIYDFRGAPDDEDDNTFLYVKIKPRLYEKVCFRFYDDDTYAMHPSLHISGFGIGDGTWCVPVVSVAEPEDERLKKRFKLDEKERWMGWGAYIDDDSGDDDDDSNDDEDDFQAV